MTRNGVLGNSRGIAILETHAMASYRLVSVEGLGQGVHMGKHHKEGEIQPESQQSFH